jgi:hypothetical protein
MNTPTSTTSPSQSTWLRSVVAIFLGFFIVAVFGHRRSPASAQGLSTVGEPIPAGIECLALSYRIVGYWATIRRPVRTTP